MLVERVSFGAYPLSPPTVTQSFREILARERLIHDGNRCFTSSYPTIRTPWMGMSSPLRLRVPPSAARRFLSSPRPSRR